MFFYLEPRNPCLPADAPARSGVNSPRMLGRAEPLGTGNAGDALRGNRCHIQDVTPLQEITARRVLHSHCNSVLNYLNLSLHLVVGRAQEMAPIP